MRERAHEVAPAQLDRVHPQLPGGGVDRRLDQLGRLRPPGAAVGRGRDLVRARPGDDHLDRRDVVRAGQQHRRGVRRDRGARQQVRAQVGQHAAAQREDPSVRVQRELHPAANPPALRRGLRLLAAILGPAHRPPELGGRERDDRRLHRQRALGAEPAADVRARSRAATPRPGAASARAARAAGGHSATTSTPSAGRHPARPARRCPPARRSPAARSRARSARRAPPARTRPPRRPRAAPSAPSGRPPAGRAPPAAARTRPPPAPPGPRPARGTQPPRPRRAARRTAPPRPRAAGAGSPTRPAPAAA